MRKILQTHSIPIVGKKKEVAPAEPTNTFEPNVLNTLKHIYDRSERKAYSNLTNFLRYISSTDSDAQLQPPAADLSQPLSSYYISSSHNTYLTGHQLYGSANIDGYKNVLLKSCRCVEIDCWNGEDEDENGNKKESEPVVLHGYTATKQIPFRTVCEAIKEYAFINTDLPLILSLEVHTNHHQQKMMVDILREVFKGMLCDATDNTTTNEKVTPHELLNKVLVKVKYNAVEKPLSSQSIDKIALKKTTTEATLATIESRSSSDDDDSSETAKKTKPKKIIDSLSHMGIYTRSYHYSSLSKPEAKIPHHVFSLSESALTGVHKEEPAALFEHNKSFLMRAYPKGTRISSSNLDPSPFWRAGVQLVALNWQKVDKGMMLQEAMFSGTGGLSLKPTNYLQHATYEEARSHLVSAKGSSLHITILEGQHIPLPVEFVEDGKEENKLKPFVKCEVHVETLDGGKEERKRLGKPNALKRKIEPSKGRNPSWGSQVGELKFDNLPPLLPELSFVRFKVVHSRLGQDNFSSWACIRLDRLATGYRLIHLRDSKGDQTTGFLLAKVQFDWNRTK